MNDHIVICIQGVVFGDEGVEPVEVQSFATDLKKARSLARKLLHDIVDSGRATLIDGDYDDDQIYD